MPATRAVAHVFASRPTTEGAGVHLRRAFGFGKEHLFDPFLMLDDFRGDRSEDYVRGFPWHPHRGIETITYMLTGRVAHGDSLGNRGVIGPGDVQWMTAGGGIVHQEMPQGDADGRMGGFQLWANLPARQKMMAPRYRDVTAAQIPSVPLEGGVTVKVVAGVVAGVAGPVNDVVIAPEYLDVTLPPSAVWRHPTPISHTAFCYVFQGGGIFAPATQPVASEHVALWGEGDTVEIVAGERGARLLFIAGRPLREPIAWGGPIVMNTKEELDLAFEEFRSGRFIK